MIDTRPWASDADPDDMMISNYDIDSQIEDTKWIIELMKESILLSLHDHLSEQALRELNDLIEFENKLYTLEGKKKNDCNH